jgi:hypothetical protein
MTGPNRLGEVFCDRGVGFTNSDCESGLQQTVMSALPQIADVCGALARRFRAVIRSRTPIYSNRARIAVSSKCFGLITSLLKFSEKVSKPGGHGSLRGVLFTEALPDCVLNIG